MCFLIRSRSRVYLLSTFFFQNSTSLSQSHNFVDKKTKRAFSFKQQESSRKIQRSTNILPFILLSLTLLLVSHGKQGDWTDEHRSRAEAEFFLQKIYEYQLVNGATVESSKRDEFSILKQFSEWKVEKSFFIERHEKKLISVKIGQIWLELLDNLQLDTTGE